MEASPRRDFAQQYLQRLRDVLSALSVDALERALEVLERAYVEGRQVFLAGNGGSAATASHMATDLSKTVAGGAAQHRGFRAIALTDNVPLMSAWANDLSYDEVFAAPLRTLARRGDVLVVVSGSGESKNIVRAVTVARELGLVTIGLLGREGGAVRGLVDVAVIVPTHDYGPIEDTHLAINHLITAYFMARVSQVKPGRVRPAAALRG